MICSHSLALLHAVSPLITVALVLFLAIVALSVPWMGLAKRLPFRLVQAIKTKRSGLDGSYALMQPHTS